MNKDNQQNDTRLKTTLCYIEKDEKYLMLFRNKKENDLNEGKWIGIGGKFEPGETPEECLLREVKEETGLTLTKFQFRGIIGFISDQWENEDMYLYTASGFEGELMENCDEGDLRWIEKNKIMNLNLWEGDRLFLPLLINGEKDIYMTLYYEGDSLKKVFREKSEKQINKIEKQQKSAAGEI